MSRLIKDFDRRLRPFRSSPLVSPRRAQPTFHLLLHALSLLVLIPPLSDLGSTRTLEAWSPSTAPSRGHHQRLHRHHFIEPYPNPSLSVCVATSRTLLVSRTPFLPLRSRCFSVSWWSLSRSHRRLPWLPARAVSQANSCPIHGSISFVLPF